MMVETLNLDSIQKNQIDSIYGVHHQELNRVEHEMDSLERSEISEEGLNLRISVLNQEKRDIREFRELDVLNTMTKEQQAIYAEKIKPEKPKVLHFGLHDRANCKVCLK